MTTKAPLRRIHLWNVTTGRQRARFDSTSDGKLLRLIVSERGTELVAAFDNGKIVWWDLTPALREVREFEASLAKLYGD